VDRADARYLGIGMLVLLFSACTHPRPAAVSWGSFDPDERRPVAPGHLPFRGELEVGATYEAFAALEETPPPGQLRIVASRYAPEYFPASIHWRNGAEALEAVEPGEWHSITFDVVAVTESPVDQEGSIGWVPEYECDLEQVVPLPAI
jgi:hypothetical protein